LVNFRKLSKMSISLLPLGAGQDVGRSCILATVGGRNIILDCGIHMVEERKIPDFERLKSHPKQKFDDFIDCVLISHFHLDHCGALPYFSEMCGYNGAIVMTDPTRALIPMMLEDYRKIYNDQNTDSNIFTSQMITACMRKVKSIQLNQTIRIKDIEITAYYAGHVLGAVMFLIECNGQKLVYTGDYNMTADRHLGSAHMDRVRPDVFITETTYATTIRDSKRTRERDFLMHIQETIDRGGKVLIPVFALGRAQELCILLETYWTRQNLKTPIYFAAGLTERANFYYRLFINWTNEKIKQDCINKNMFNFEHIKAFDKAYIHSPDPMVLFATPGMLHAGLALQVFKEWCGDERNTIIIPGYCMPGTIGAHVLSGAKNIIIDKKNYEVNCTVRSISFSAHVDSPGIMKLIDHVKPKNVVLVHGEKVKMTNFAKIVESDMKLPCYYPANYEYLKIDLEQSYQVYLSPLMMNNFLGMSFCDESIDRYLNSLSDSSEDMSIDLTLSPEDYANAFSDNPEIEIDALIKNTPRGVELHTSSVEDEEDGNHEDRDIGVCTAQFEEIFDLPSGNDNISFSKIISTLEMKYAQKYNKKHQRFGPVTIKYTEALNQVHMSWAQRHDDFAENLMILIDSVLN